MPPYVITTEVVDGVIFYSFRTPDKIWYDVVKLEEEE